MSSRAPKHLTGKNRKFTFVGPVKKLHLDGTIHTVRRIEALRDIRDGIPKGTIGGWLEFASNLSSIDLAWVADGAYILGKTSKVEDDAFVCDDAKVINSTISGSAIVGDQSQVRDSSVRNGKVKGNARVTNSQLDRSYAVHEVQLYGVTAYESYFTGRVDLRGLHEDRTLSFTSSWAMDETTIDGRGTFENAILDGPETFFTIGPIGSAGGTLTVYLSQLNEIMLHRGCFTGNTKEFTRRVNKTRRSRYGQQYLLIAEMAQSRIRPLPQKTVAKYRALVDHIWTSDESVYYS